MARVLEHVVGYGDVAGVRRIHVYVDDVPWQVAAGTAGAIQLVVACRVPEHDPLDGHIAAANSYVRGAGEYDAAGLARLGAYCHGPFRPAGSRRQVDVAVRPVRNGNDAAVGGRLSCQALWRRLQPRCHYGHLASRSAGCIDGAAAGGGIDRGRAGGRSPDGCDAGVGSPPDRLDRRVAAARPRPVHDGQPLPVERAVHADAVGREPVQEAARLVKDDALARSRRGRVEPAAVRRQPRLAGHAARQVVPLQRAVQVEDEEPVVAVVEFHVVGPNRAPDRARPGRHRGVRRAVEDNPVDCGVVWAERAVAVVERQRAQRKGEPAPGVVPVQGHGVRRRVGRRRVDGHPRHVPCVERVSPARAAGTVAERQERRRAGRHVGHGNAGLVGRDVHQSALRVDVQVVGARRHRPLAGVPVCPVRKRHAQPAQIPAGADRMQVRRARRRVAVARRHVQVARARVGRHGLDDVARIGRQSRVHDHRVARAAGVVRGDRVVVRDVQPVACAIELDQPRAGA